MGKHFGHFLACVQVALQFVFLCRKTRDVNYQIRLQEKPSLATQLLSEDVWVLHGEQKNPKTKHEIIMFTSQNRCFMKKMPGFLAETSEKLLGKGWGTTQILKANSQNVKQKFLQEGKISTEILGLFYLHKAKKCLLIPLKQYIGVAQKTLGLNKNNKTMSPGAPLFLQIFKLCASSERQLSSWELELENGDPGIIFGSAFCSLWLWASHM